MGYATEQIICPRKKRVHFLCDRSGVCDFILEDRKTWQGIVRLAELIINKLREAEVYLAEGMRVELGVKKLSVVNEYEEHVVVDMYSTSNKLPHKGVDFVSQQSPAKKF